MDTTAEAPRTATMPHNLDAERSVLGAILLDNQAMYPAAETLTPQDFYCDGHKFIFKAMLTLSQNKAAIDVITLADQLERGDRVDRIGGLGYLSSLVDGLPRAANVDNYARIVKDKASLRSMIASANAVIDSAFAPDAEVHGLAARLIATGEAVHAIDRKEPEPTPTWPEPMAPEALHGLTGDFVRLVGPQTEADSAALVAGFLSAAGNLIGPGPHLRVEADLHPARLFIVLVGETSKGRKGTAWSHIRRVAAEADESWVERVQSGLSSGEGVIHAVRDPVTTLKDGELEVTDAGVSDKRLQVVEAEYASTLRVLGRDGNTLSAVIRCAWDDGNLQTLTKGNPTRATKVHVSVLGNITRDELRRYLTRTEAGNGFANRFLWVCVRRSKELPFGGEVDSAQFEKLVGRIRGVVATARTLRAMTWDQKTRPLWEAVYGDLSEGRAGLLGAVTSRAEAQVVRLAVTYAALDGSATIRPEHLAAALSVWEYCAASARYIFGDDLGDPISDAILRPLIDRPRGMTRTEINRLFGGNRRSQEIGEALQQLLALGLVTVEKKDTRGRSAEVWRRT